MFLPAVIIMVLVVVGILTPVVDQPLVSEDNCQTGRIVLRQPSNFVSPQLESPKQVDWADRAYGEPYHPSGYKGWPSLLTAELAIILPRHLINTNFTSFKINSHFKIFHINPI